MGKLFFYMHKILIVEDETDLGEIYKNHIAEAGYEVEWVKTAEDAETIITSFPADLIILDQRLAGGGKQGIDALPGLKQKLPQALFVVCSNYSFGMEDTAREAGADDYWIKINIDMQGMLQRIAALLKNK